MGRPWCASVLNGQRTEVHTLISTPFHYILSYITSAAAWVFAVRVYDNLVNSIIGDHRVKPLEPFEKFTGVLCIFIQICQLSLVGYRILVTK